MKINKDDLNEELLNKLKKLETYIESLGSLAVGFSGGVDSSLLLAVAKEVLGDNVIAVTGTDASVPEREVKEATKFCEERGIKHIICRVNPLREAGLRKNEIRIISKAMGLPTWSKPAYACLASRFVYGEEITEENQSIKDLQI